MANEIKAGKLTRSLALEGFQIRKEADGLTRLTFSASSETPVERYFGSEVLSHDPGAVRLGRMNSGAAPMLFNHNSDDPIGMVDGARVTKGRLIVDAHFFATARAQEIQAMVEGGLRNVSIQYRLHTIEENTKTATFTATDWEPLEASLVSIPADESVGIGRGLGDELPVRMVRAADDCKTAIPADGVRQMTEATNATAGNGAENPTNLVARSEAEASSAVDFEKARKAAILNLCRANSLDERHAQRWITNGSDLTTVAAELLQVMQERGKNNPQAATFLDMGATEVRRYSMMRALRAAASKDWTKAGLELEANKEISKRLNQVPKSSTSFFVPLDVMMRDMLRTQQRDMTVAGVSGSNYLTQTDNAPGSFIELLRNTSVGLRMGVTRLAGLQGNVTIPKMTAGNTAYWLTDENTQITESQPTIAQLALAPKNVAALTELSHQLLQQSSPDAEQLVLSSIARDIALAVDVGILRGSGASGQPTGIVNTGGIGAFTGTSLAAPGILNAQGDVAAANALYPGCGYVTTPAVAELLMQRPELPSTGTTRLWKGNMLEGSMFDLPALSSAQMLSATALFGWWPSVVLGEWGVLELMTNPFSDFTRGLTAVRGWYTCDVGVRYAGAWSYSSSIT
jgi:hypothetical protein